MAQDAPGAPVVQRELVPAIERRQAELGPLSIDMSAFGAHPVAPAVAGRLTFANAASLFAMTASRALKRGDCNEGLGDNYDDYEQHDE
jgi:hypothetical protein